MVNTSYDEVRSEILAASTVATCASISRNNFSRALDVSQFVCSITTSAMTINKFYLVIQFRVRDMLATNIIKFDFLKSRHCSNEPNPTNSVPNIKLVTIHNPLLVYPYSRFSLSNCSLYALAFNLFFVHK